jgi:hypothetical protein
MTILTAEKIEATVTYHNASKIAQSFLTKRASRELIHHALIVYRNTGAIPENVSGKNLAVLKELIFDEENPKTELLQ